MRIVNDEAFNAFVIDGRNVFMNTGTLMQANTPNEVIGVLAHEAGHISGGHMAALRSRIAKDQTRALLIQLLGIGAMIGGAASGSSEIGSAGQRRHDGRQRAHHARAHGRASLEDRRPTRRASAFNATQQSGLGMLTTFERFAGQELFSDVHQTHCARTHPVATDRLARLRQLVEGSPYYKTKDAPELQRRHDMMRAKLSGYMEAPSIVFNRYPLLGHQLPGALCACDRVVPAGRRCPRARDRQCGCAHSRSAS